jgi:uncharacterized alkaline shock family protein YloU
MTNGADGAPTQVGDLADRIVAAVTECPSVAGLGQIPGIPVATYLPGRTVSGVAVRASEVEISVVARFGVPLPQVAAQIRQAVAPLVPNRVVDVVIADITAPEAQPEAAAAAVPASAGRADVRRRS